MDRDELLILAAAPIYAALLGAHATEAAVDGRCPACLAGDVAAAYRATALREAEALLEDARTRAYRARAVAALYAVRAQT